MAENNIEYKIQLSRGEFIEESRAIAVLRLNEREFAEGEVAIINYYKNADLRTNIGTLVALGVTAGKGVEHYRILSTGDTVLVRNVVSQLPDVSALVHGEVYVYVDPDEVWYYVYKNSYEDERSITPITGGPFVFLDTESGYRWFYRDQVCQREDDFLSRERTELILQQLVLQDGYLEVTSRNGYLFESGQVKDIYLEIKAWNRAQTAPLTGVSYYINGEPIAITSTGSYTYRNVSKDTSLLVEARIYLIDDLYLTYARQIDIYFGHKFYYGVVPDNWEPTNGDSITGRLSYKLSRKIDFDWSEIALNMERTVFAYPEKYGFLEHIYDDNGLDYIYEYNIYRNISIDNVEYNCYLKRSAVSIVDFRQIYSFEPIAMGSKTVDLSNVADIDGENILNIVKSWRNRNMANGLLLLDEDGKIPDEILHGDDTLAGQVIVIAEELENYPVGDMTKGCVYYITSAKRLYHAIDESHGEILYPNENLVYIYHPDLTLRKWNPSTETFEYETGLSSQRIYSIEELIS